MPGKPDTPPSAPATPGLLLVQGEIMLGSRNPRLWAGLVAIIVAALLRNTAPTIGRGFAALFLRQHP